MEHNNHFNPKYRGRGNYRVIVDMDSNLRNTFNSPDQVIRASQNSVLSFGKTKGKLNNLTIETRFYSPNEQLRVKKPTIFPKKEESEIRVISTHSKASGYDHVSRSLTRKLSRDSNSPKRKIKVVPKIKSNEVLFPKVKSDTVSSPSKTLK